MPGLSFVVDLDQRAAASISSFERALAAACHDAHYRARVLIRDPAYLLATSTYPEYPLAELDFGDVAVHLEGRLYGPTPAAALLQTLAATLFEDDDAAQRWLRNVDGEFVIVARQRSSGRVVVLNDTLGRLPLYCRRTERTLLLSREARVVARLVPRVRLDRMGMAQHFLLGFPLGERTLLDGVARLAPGTCLHIDPRRGLLRETRAPGIDLSPVASTAPTRDVAPELAAHFISACRGRAAECGANLVSLSGGADARSVAAGLRRSGVSFDAVTFLDAAGEAAADAGVAEQLARVFGAPWQLFRLPPPTTTDRRELLQRKQGLNPLSMAYLLPYLRQIVASHGRGVVLFTGDGGDKVLPDLRPAESAGDADRAAAALLRRHQKAPLEDVAALTGIGAADILLELRDRLNAFPEAQWSDRCVHFEIFERGFKWLFEGEDRNRGFCWSTTPFYAPPFFRAAMRCGSSDKSHRALYRDFLLALSPAAAGIDYAGVGAPIDSDAFRVAAKAAALLAERASASRVAAIAGTAPAESGDREAADQLRQQLRAGGAIADHLDAGRWVAFLDGPAAASPHAIDALATVAALIEDLAGAASDADRVSDSAIGAGALAERV